MFLATLSLSLCLSLSVCIYTFVPQELADTQEPNTLEESTNQWAVVALYDALSSRDVDTVHKLLAPNLDWWFHGPPSNQFMTRILTGHTATSSRDSFRFVPQSIAAFGSTVLVEGCDQSRSISWVHAWTVTHGIITQDRVGSCREIGPRSCPRNIDPRNCITYNRE